MGSRVKQNDPMILFLGIHSDLLPSGYVKIAIENGDLDWFIVNLPINSMVIFHSYVSLPEGTSYFDAHPFSLGFEWFYPFIFPMAQWLK